MNREDALILALQLAGEKVLVQQRIIARLEEQLKSVSKET